MGLEPFPQLTTDPVSQPEVGRHCRSGDSLDAADTGRHTALRYQMEDADFGGVGHVGATAELHGYVWHVDHANHLAVLLPEHGNRSLGHGLVNGHLGDGEGVRLQDPAVDEGLHLLQGGCIQGVVAVEVEAQTVHVHEGASLGNTGTRYLLERSLQQVGGGVVDLGAAAAPVVHPKAQMIAKGQGAVLNLTDMEHEAVQFLRIPDRHAGGLAVAAGGDAPHSGSRLQHPLIAHLASRLAVEAGAGKAHLNLIARAGTAHGLAINDQCLHLGFGIQRVVAGKNGSAKFSRQGSRCVTAGHVQGRCRGFGPLPLLGHGLLKAGFIHRQPLLPGNLRRELQGEAVGVVELKGLLTADGFRTGREDVDQELLATFEGVEKPRFLLHQLVHNRGLPLPQLGIGTFHQRNGGLRQRFEERLVNADAATMAQDAPDQPPQHVAAAQVGGGDAVPHELGNGPGVIADHLQGRLLAVAGLGVVQTRPGCSCRDQGIDEIRFVVVGLVLQDLRHPLQPHTRIDVPVAERCECAVAVPVRLHEHEVVELDEATVVLQVDGVVTTLGVEVEVELGAGAAGTGGSGTPEVVGFTEAHDAPGGYPHTIPPDGGRRVVLVKHAHHQLFGLQTKPFGAEFPRPQDRLFLEVVAKGEVAEHLEVGVVPRGAAHVLDVVGADALLGARGTRCGARLQTQEGLLEGQHPGNGEQHRGVFGYEGRAGQHLVAAGSVEVQEGLANGCTRTGRVINRLVGGVGTRGRNRHGHSCE